MIKLLWLSVFIFVFTVTTSVDAQPTSSDKFLPIQVYAQAWKERNTEARLKLIKTIWLKESTYEDPASFTKGPEEFNALIDKFYLDFPDVVLEAEPMLSKGNYATWNWRIVDSKKTFVLAGRDVVELDGKGHILKVIGFWEEKNSSNENIKPVASYYECLFKTRDFNTLSTLIAPGAVYYQAEGLPYGGTFTGFENWTKMFIRAAGLFDLQIEKEPSYFINTEGGVIIRFTIKCTAKKSGNVISMPIAEHFELKDGKIISIRPFYFDTKRFADFLE